MKYLPIFPELMEELSELDDASIGRMVRAMSAYAFDGVEPTFDKGTPERILWPVFRLKIDGWRDKSEKKAAAGAAGGEANGSKPKQTEANESKPKQKEATGSKPKPQSQSQTQSQSEPQPEEDPEDVDTHTEIYGERPRARARRSTWYDPEHPERSFDNAWRFSEPARLAVAQRILETVLNEGLQVIPVPTDTGNLGEELLQSLEAAMRAGIPPDECQRIGERDRKSWLWEGHLKQLALDAGTAPPGRFEAWQNQVSECAEDLQEPAAAYG